MSDFSNRRKELKFAAVDLKLHRRQQDAEIGHLGVWRRDAPPKTYFLWADFLWAARMCKADVRGTMTHEARSLTNTYLEGVGLFAWRENAERTGYEPVPVPREDVLWSLDDALFAIESEIKRMTRSDNTPPPPLEPTRRAVPVDELPETDAEGTA